MLVTHIYFNGQCKEAIDLYIKAFGAAVNTIIQEPTQGKAVVVIHAEICIHDQRLMLNDFGDNDGFSTSGGYQLVLSFENEEALKDAYSVMKEGSTTVTSMRTTEYSGCVVRFIDKFGVRWAFMV